MHQNSYQTIVTGIMLVRNSEGKYLFLRRSSEEHYGAGLWDFPGGAKEFLESPEEGAFRECKEESGIAVKDEKKIWYFVTRAHTDPTTEFVSFMYVGEAGDQQVQLSSEHDDYKWMTMEAAQQELETVHWMQTFFKELEAGTIKL